MEATFGFEVELCEWKAEAPRVFVTLPAEVAEEIHDMALPRRGFGSVKVRARVGATEWRTSVFPDSKSGSYVLPVNQAVRSAARIEIGDVAAFEIDVAPE